MTITDTSTTTSVEHSYQVWHTTPRLGAEFTGLDLAAGVDDATAAALRDAFHTRKVLVFRDQHLTPDQHVAAVSIFAEPFDHPTAVRHADNHLVYPYDAQRHGKASTWHIGGLWREPVFRIESLVYETVPDTGGDTLWADLQAAYDDLSPAFQQLLEGVRAIYDANPVNYSQGADRTPPASTVAHPLVRTDPDTGRKGLFLSTSAIGVTGLSPAEGDAVLQYLFRHASSPKYSVRYSWRPGDFALWDNQATWHYAVDDYGTAPRTYRKVIGVDPTRQGPLVKSTE